MHASGSAARWRWCAAVGCLAFLCSWSFGRIPGLVACGPAHGLGPIIAFELARNPAEVVALFGVDPCRATLVAAQKTALLLDAFGFIPAYTAFLILAVGAVSSEWRWRWFVIAALLIAGLCDEIEGGLLHAILRDLPGSPALLSALRWEVHIKFAALALGTLAIGAMLLASRRWVGAAFGLVVILGGSEALYGFIVMPSPVMMRGFAHAWVPLLIAAFIGSVASSLFSPARASPPRPRAAPIL